MQEGPTFDKLDIAIALSILLYGITISVTLLATSKSFTGVIGMLSVVAAALVGPFLNLLLKVQAGRDSNHAAKVVQFLPEAFLRFLRQGESRLAQEGGQRFSGSWAFVNWEDVMDAGRQGDETGPNTAPNTTHSSTWLHSFTDMKWQRRRLYELTGSYSGFLVWPIFAWALGLALAATALQATTFACARGELAQLQVAGLWHALNFAPGQDRYLIAVDQSVTHVDLAAAGQKARTANVSVEPPAAWANEAAVQTLIPLNGMPVPRLARVTVQGVRPRQLSATYSISIAPRARLPRALVISDAAGGSFERRISWGALPSSLLSIPPSVKELNVTVLFADFIVAVPLEKVEQGKLLQASPEAVFSTFAHNSKVPSLMSACDHQCTANPDCLAFFRGQTGCYFAMHDHTHHEKGKPNENAESLAEIDEAVGDPFQALLSGCIHVLL